MGVLEELIEIGFDFVLYFCHLSHLAHSCTQDKHDLGKNDRIFRIFLLCPHSTLNVVTGPERLPITDHVRPWQQAYRMPFPIPMSHGVYVFAQMHGDIGQPPDQTRIIIK